MSRQPTGRPRGRQPGSGALGLGTDDPHKRLTMRLPNDLYDRLMAFAEGRSFTRGTPQLAGCVRALLEHALACPYKRQTANIPLPAEHFTGQTLNSPSGAEDISGQTSHNVVLVDSAQQAAQPALDYDPTKYHLGKLCYKHHEWGTTGKSLRANNKAGYCLACNGALNKASKKRKTRAASGA